MHSELPSPLRPRDVNQPAKNFVDVATGQRSDAPTGPKRRQRSGLARAASMTPDERRESAKKGAAAR